MKRCLVDVNVLLALVVRHHEHHGSAGRWFEGLAAREAVVCRFVQLALIRLLGNRAIMGDFVLSGSAAWALVEELMEDERLEFAAEPASTGTLFPRMLRYPGPTPKLVGDAYLAAFALAGQLRLTTIDRGFQGFTGLELELVGQRKL